MNVNFRFFDGSVDWGWVREKLPVLRVEDTGGLIAYDVDTNKQLAACIWDNWTKTTVQVHLLIENPLVLRKGFLEEIADYLFNYSNRKAIYGWVPASNTKAIKIDLNIGFTIKAVLEDGFAEGEDYILVELKKENCRHRPKCFKEQVA